ncbi:MAG: hypothetical protein P8X57_11940, partial [Cyclobacteriaceae bacterium]
MTRILIPVVFILIFVCCESDQPDLSAELKGIGNDTIYVEWFSLNESIGASEPRYDTLVSLGGRFSYSLSDSITALAIFTPQSGTLTGAGNRRIKWREKS